MKPLKVMVIDDEAAIRQIVAANLLKAGYDVLGESESRAQAESISLLSQQEEQSALMTRLQAAVVLSVPLMAAHWLQAAKRSKPQGYGRGGQR